MPARLADDLRTRIDERMRKAGRFRSAADSAFGNRDYETSASRCYYAAFHAATAVLMAHGKPEAERWRKHDEVINQCITLSTKRNKWFVELRMSGVGSFAQSFRRLYTFRLEADYGSAPVDRRRAKDALVFVREFLIGVKERIP